MFEVLGCIIIAGDAFVVASFVYHAVEIIVELFVL